MIILVEKRSLHRNGKAAIPKRCNFPQVLSAHGEKHFLNKHRCVTSFTVGMMNKNVWYSNGQYAVNKYKIQGLLVYSIKGIHNT